MPAKRYTRKPMPVEAWQVNTEDEADLAKAAAWAGVGVLAVPGAGRPAGLLVVLGSDESTLAAHGDWLVQTPTGQIVVVEGESFPQGFDPVPERTPDRHESFHMDYPGHVHGESFDWAGFGW